MGNVILVKSYLCVYIYLATHHNINTILPILIHSHALKSIQVNYLSPIVLRKSMENILFSENNFNILTPSFVDEHPILFWNLVCAILFQVFSLLFYSESLNYFLFEHYSLSFT